MGHSGGDCDDRTMDSGPDGIIAIAIDRRPRPLLLAQKQLSISSLLATNAASRKLFYTAPNPDR